MAPAGADSPLVMDFEAILVTAVLATATLPMVVATFRAARRKPVGLAAGVSWVAFTAIVAVAATDKPRPPVRERIAHLRPLEDPAEGYVTSDTCQACHPEQYETWHDSYHRTMTQVATPETVRAPWNGESAWARGREYVFERNGDEFFVEMDDPDWTGSGDPPRVWKQVVQITGSHHWQFYWYATGDTRKIALLLCAWRISDGERWTPVDACCLTPPRGGQETGTGRWNMTCNRCHATHARPRVANQEVMDTHVSELGIACEACHGPAEEHIRVNRDPRHRYALHAGSGEDPTIVDPADLSKELSSVVCGNCHAFIKFTGKEALDEYNTDGYAYRPGEDLEDAREWVLDGGDDHFWPDGMPRVGGREYTSLVGNPCYVDGEMSCMSCHAMHKAADDPRSTEEWADDQLKYGMRGNSACTQCHEEYADGSYLTAHTHHGAESSGSNCYNCHMSFTSYGLLKATRSHRIDSPSVAATLANDRIAACNQCHLDKTLAWTGEKLEEWYGHQHVDLPPEHEELATSVLWGLQGDAGKRALVAWSMGWDPARQVSGTDWMTPLFTVLIRDPYMQVRYIAERSFRKQPEHAAMEDYDFAVPPKGRNAARALAAWRASERETFGGALLIDEDMRWKLERVDELLETRDNHPFFLNE